MTTTSITVGWVSAIGSSWKATLTSTFGGQSRMFDSPLEAKAFVQDATNRPLIWSQSNAADQPTQYAGNATIQRTTIVNVDSYGAVGDGVTDDTAAIQTAMDAVATTGGVVEFDTKTYALAGTLKIRSYTTLEGGNCTLKRIGALKRRLIENANYGGLGGATVDVQFAIKEMTLVGTGDTIGVDDQAHAIGFWKVADVLLEDLSTSNTNGDGIAYRQGDRVIVRRVSIGNFGRNGFSPSSGSDCHFEQVSVVGTSFPGANPGLDFDVENDTAAESSTTTWVDCSGKSVTFVDFFTASGGVFAHQASLSDCTFTGGFEPIVIQSSNPTTATAFYVNAGNVLETPNGSCIRVQNVSNVHVNACALNAILPVAFGANGIWIVGTVTGLTVDRCSIDTNFTNSVLVYPSMALPTPAHLNESTINDTSLATLYLRGANNRFVECPTGSLTIAGAETTGNVFDAHSHVSWMATQDGGDLAAQTFYGNP